MKTPWRMAVVLLGVLVIGEPADAQQQCGAGSCMRAACARDPAEAAERQQPVMAVPVLTQLQGTLTDEYRARDFYREAAERFGGRQFANLTRAEQHHIDALTRIVRAAGAAPVTSAGRTVEAPPTLAATRTEAALREREMIAAYDVLLARVTDPAVRPMLERIQLANRRHLAAASGERGQRGQRGQHGRRGQGRQAPARGEIGSKLSPGNQGVDSVPRCGFGSRSCRR